MSPEKKKRYWLESSVLHNYFTTCMWELKIDWARYIKEKYHCKYATCLSMGCGTGELGNVSKVGVK